MGFFQQGLSDKGKVSLSPQKLLFSTSKSSYIVSQHWSPFSMHVDSECGRRQENLQRESTVARVILFPSKVWITIKVNKIAIVLRECSISSVGRLYWKVFYLCQRGFGQNLFQFCEEYLICSCPCTHNSKYALKHLGRNNPSQQHMLWTDQLNSSSAEKDVGVLVENWTWASNASLQQKSPASSGITLLRG